MSLTGDNADVHQRVHAERDAYVAHRDINIGSQSAPQHVFDYTQMVKRFAPTALQDREAELAELRDFCLRPSGESYIYWTGTAWAGKTAVMATFVLAPVLPGVTFVPFFIRAGDQDDYQDFLRVVTRQLGVFLGEVPPSDPSHADFDSMLGAAAEKCRQASGRLVLVVDGLDEDWYASRTKPRRRPSIASLLPEQPPGGMRVIVSGRPNPPIPDDVPDGHPLLDPAIVRNLTPSPSARLSERQAKRDLTDMLEESPLSRQLLGLIVAAETGLSTQALMELTSKNGWEIEKRLGTVSGRVLHRLAEDGWSTGEPDGSYQLAHTDLRELARNLLGRDLRQHRQRLLVWAEEYRELGWPSRTPEYLLRGYFRMLREASDTDEMVACAVDAVRQDRMLDMSGGQVAALDEIAQAQDAVLANVVAGTMDLPPLVLLGMRHCDLTWGSEHIPALLPAAWARLGRHERAKALAYSEPYEPGRLLALAQLAKTFTLAGDAERGRLLANEVIQFAATMPLGSATSALIAVIGVLAASGYPGEAEDLARSSFPREASIARCEALANAVAPVHGDELARSRAVTIARDVEALARRVVSEQRADRRSADVAGILIWAVTAWAKAGDGEHARAIAQEIDDSLNTADFDDTRSYRWRDASRAWLEVGETDRGYALARRLAEADSMLGELAAYAVADAAIAYVRAGQVVRAEQVARTITDSEPDDQAKARIKVLSVVVNAWKESGDLGGAHAVAQQLEELARSVTWPSDRAAALTSAAHAWIDAGVNDRAEALVREATDVARTGTNVPKQRVFAYPGTTDSQLAEVHAAMDALATARDRPTAEVQLLRAAVPAAAGLGRASCVESIARHIIHAPSRDWALTAADRMNACAPFLKRWSFLDDPEKSQQFTAMIRIILSGGSSDWLVEDQQWGLGGTGDTHAESAEAFLYKFLYMALELWSMEAQLSGYPPDRPHLVAGQAEVYADVITTFRPMFAEPEERRVIDDLCSSAEPSQIDRGYAFARSLLSLDDRAWELVGAARAWTKRGGYIYGLQELLAESLNTILRARFLALAASAWRCGGDNDRTRAAARKAEQTARDQSATATNPASRTLLFAIAADAWVKAGNDARARNLAFETEDQARNMPADKSNVHQAWALGDAAVAWVVSGDPARAVAVAETIGGQRRQAAALIRMAQHADDPLATTFQARALRLGPGGWGLAVNAMTLLKPEALVTAAEHLTGNS